jgi:olfactory receptor
LIPALPSPILFMVCHVGVFCPPVLGLHHYITISNSLCYFSILTNMKIGVIILFRSSLLIPPVITWLKFLDFCRPHFLSHSFYLHQDLIQRSCSDILFNSIYALALVSCALFLDVVLILTSYILIWHTVLVTASREESIKSLQTCVSHICAVSVFYIPIIGLTMMNHFGKHLSPLAHALISNIYIFFPPLMDPIIDSIITQQIWVRVQHFVLCERILSSEIQCECILNQGEELKRMRVI